MADTTQDRPSSHGRAERREAVNAMLWLVIGAVLALGVVVFVLTGGLAGEGLTPEPPADAATAGDPVADAARAFEDAVAE